MASAKALVMRWLLVMENLGLFTQDTWMECQAR